MSREVRTEVFIPPEATIRTVPLQLLPHSITKQIKLRPLCSKQPITLISPIELRKTARAPPLSPGRSFFPVVTSNRPAFQLLQTVLRSGPSAVEFEEVRTRSDPVLRKPKSCIILYDGELFLSVRKNRARDWSEEQPTATIHESDAPPTSSPVTQDGAADDIIGRRRGDETEASKDHGNFMENEAINDVIEDGGSEDTDIEADDGGDTADGEWDNPQKFMTDSSTNTSSSISIKIKVELDNPANRDEISNGANIEEGNVNERLWSAECGDELTACNITKKSSSSCNAQAQSLSANDYHGEHGEIVNKENTSLNVMAVKETSKNSRSDADDEKHEGKGHPSDVPPSLIEYDKNEQTPEVWKRVDVAVSDADDKMNSDEDVAGNQVNCRGSEVQRSSADLEIGKIENNLLLTCRRRLNFYNGGAESSCHGDDVITLGDESPTNDYYYSGTADCDVIQIDDDDDDDADDDEDDMIACPSVSVRTNDCCSNVKPLLVSEHGETLLSNAEDEKREVKGYPSDVPSSLIEYNVGVAISDTAKKMNTNEVVTGNGFKGHVSEVQSLSSDLEITKIERNGLLTSHKRLHFNSSGAESSWNGDVITLGNESPTNNNNNTKTLVSVSRKIDADVIQIDDDDVIANSDATVLGRDDNNRSQIEFCVSKRKIGDTRVVDITTKRNTAKVVEAELSEEAKRREIINDDGTRDERDDKSVSTNVRVCKRKHSDCHTEECFVISDGEHAKVSKPDHMIHTFDQENGNEGGLSLEAANRSGVSPAPSTSTTLLNSIDHTMRIREEKIARLEEKLRNLKNNT